MQKRFLRTDLPVWLALGLIAITLPRGILNDLGIVADDSLAYQILALAPAAVWLVVAVFRKTRKPWLDFGILGLMYGLLLGLTHQIFWGVSWNHHPPGIAVELAATFDPSFEEFILRSVTFLISLAIGLGAGLFFGCIAAVAKGVRTRNSPGAL